MITQPPVPLKHHLGAIFVHIPKTAGTSVHALLAASVLTPAAAEARRQVIERLTRHDPAVDRTIFPKHGKAAELRRLAGPDIWNGAFKFTLVRNPWALMVSSYFWWLQKAPQYPFLIPLAEQVRALGGFRPFLFSDIGGSMINELPGTMSDWFTESGRDLVDFVGRVETLETDMRKILAAMGAVPSQPIPHLNRSEHDDYRAYYDRTTRGMVADRFADIIDRFHYEF